MPLVAAEAGTSAYLVHAGDKPDDVVFYELYQDQAAIEQHSANLKKWIGHIKMHVARDPVVQVVPLAGGFGTSRCIVPLFWCS